MCHKGDYIDLGFVRLFRVYWVYDPLHPLELAELVEPASPIGASALVANLGGAGS